MQRTFHSAFCHRMTRRIRKLWSFYCHFSLLPFDANPLWCEQEEKTNNSPFEHFISFSNSFLKWEMNEVQDKRQTGQNPWPLPWLGFLCICVWFPFLLCSLHGYRRRMKERTPRTPPPPPHLYGDFVLFRVNQYGFVVWPVGARALSPTYFWDPEREISESLSVFVSV